MIMYLESLVKEWLESLNSSIHDGLRHIKIEDFAEKYSKSLYKCLMHSSKTYGYLIETSTENITSATYPRKMELKL